MHLTHELILSIQIKRGKVHLNWDSTVKSPCWHQVSNLWPSDPDLFRFAVVPSLQDLAIFMVGLRVISVLWVQVNLDPVILFYWDQRSMWTLKSPQNAAPTSNVVLFLSTGGKVAAPIFYFHCSQSRNLFFAQLKNLSIMLKHDLLLCSLEIPSK